MMFLLKDFGHKLKYLTHVYFIVLLDEESVNPELAELTMNCNLGVW